MLIITDKPLGLVRYHVEQNINDESIVLTKLVNTIQELEDLLLENITYNEYGELCKVVYVVLYSGSNLLSLEFNQSKTNNLYLIVKDISLYKPFFLKKKAIELNVAVNTYKYLIEYAKSILTVDAFDYFWRDFCIKKFRSNPQKWQLELQHLLLIFVKNNKIKLTVGDLDFLYNKTNKNIELYLKHMFTSSSTYYLNKLKKEDLFLLFLRTSNFKPPVLKCIELHDKQLLYSYMCFKESFLRGYIRLTEGVFLLDFVIKNNEFIDYKYVRNLFKLT